MQKNLLNKHLTRLGVSTILLMALFACQKKEFTEPVSINMEVALEQNSLSHLKFDLGIILFEQIAFNGHRNQGGDVHFATEPGIEIGPVTFPYASSGNIKNFDIPQGIYNTMKWRFDLSDIDDLGDINDSQTDDEKDYLMDEGGLLIIGQYINTMGTQIPLYISIDEDERFSCLTEGEDGIADISLLSDQSYTAQLVLNPAYAMQSISIQSLENAELSDNDGVQYMEISSDMNDNLYESVLYRLQNAAKVIIK